MYTSRVMNRRFLLPAAALIAVTLTTADGQVKPPSSYTIELQKNARQTLPFSDRRDFDESRRGFLGAPDSKQIKAADGSIVWDLGLYSFLEDAGKTDSIHPSLARQAQLNMAYGLFEVVPGRIYQARGFDLANMAVIRGQTGWILIDPLTASETAKAALEFANSKLGARPVSAVIFSHSHQDHFGGILGVATEADVKSGKIKLIAPAGFLMHAVSENVFAGNAMRRRAAYQYGYDLPRNPAGHVDQAIGKYVALGSRGLLAPNVTISKPYEEMTVDGVRMVFQNTPETEAPAEMNIWFPDEKAFFPAENITATIHNIYTLRGTLVRDALAWSKYINQALYRFGGEAEVMFAAHTWPRFGNARVKEIMRGQRDAYAQLNNQVLHLANRGVTINQMHNVFTTSKESQNQWYTRSYHGSEAHNSRGVINRYLGYWDDNPATLAPLSPGDSAPLYVEMMGGADKIVARARQLNGEGKYRHAMELLNKLVYAEPGNTEAKQLLADVFEQLGYQAESSSVRNSYLAGAKELREGIAPARIAVGPATLAGLPPALLLDFAAILMDSRKAEGAAFTINLEVTDRGEKFVVELSHGALTHIEGFQLPKADATWRLKASELAPLLITGMPGSAQIEGDSTVLNRLRRTFTAFPADFEILPGTKRK